MKIAFTTLGCPGWDLDAICRRGREYGYHGVDFRGYRETLDVTKLPLFTTGVEEVRRKLEDARLEVAGISTSIRVCEESQLAANLEEARRTIRVAKALGTRNVALLRSNGYDGWLLFEHEKRRHPDLAEPEVAFPAYARWIRKLI